MFIKDKRRKDGLGSWCRECHRKITKKYNEEHKKELKEHYEEHKEEIKEKRKKYYQEHREERLLKQKEYWEKHKEEISVYQKRHYQKNRDQILERDLKYRELRRDMYAENSRKYYREHHEECLEKKRQYYIDNKDVIMVNNQIRRARMNSADGDFTPEQVKECVDFFHNTCAYSGCQFSEEKIYCLSLDHIIPLANGGSNFVWNIVPTTFSNNASKGTKEMLSWYQEQDFYSEERLQKILEWQEYAYNKWSNNNVAF